MSTIHDELTAELAAIKARIPVIEAQLATAETEAGSWMKMERDKIEAWFGGVWSHFFPTTPAPTVPPAAPAPASQSQTASPQ